MRKCFLQGYGPCGGKMTGEHYISRTVLEAMGAKAKTGGLPWQPDLTLQNIGIDALVSKILCETHNSGLSSLDSAAGSFFRALDAMDKRAETLSAITSADGALIERWFLKVICGLSAGVRINNGVVPDTWKQTLLGGIWPDAWGLYVPAPAGSHVLATEFSFESLVNPATNEVMAAKFRLAGVHFNLLLGRPDNPSAWGTHRPRGLIFDTHSGEKRIDFGWSVHTTEAVIYSRVGTSKERAPQWTDWKE